MSVVLPGDEITREPGFLRGHGTCATPDGRLLATLAGTVERVDALVSVRALAARYAGEVGDVVVGRVVDVGAKRWRVVVRARADAVLLLSSVNLAGGVQRRRTAEDQLNMRAFFAEGDAVSAEVHALFADGSLSLHARSLEYGRLENGALVLVPPGLVARLPAHFVSLPPRAGVDAILGLNGAIWLTETPPEGARAGAGAGAGGGAGADGGGGGAAAAGASALDAAADAAEDGHAEAIEAAKRAAAARDVGAPARARMARVRAAILALARAGLAVAPDGIMDVFDESARLALAPADVEAGGAAAALAVAPAQAKARARAAAERGE